MGGLSGWSPPVTLSAKNWKTSYTSCCVRSRSRILFLSIGVFTSSIVHLFPYLHFGAERGNRTPTVSLPPDFESGASTSSAIPAERRIIPQSAARDNRLTGCPSPFTLHASPFT